MWNKVIIIVAILSIVGTAGGLAYRFVSNLQEENKLFAANNATLSANAVQLEAAIATQQETLASIQADIVFKDEVLRNVLTDFELERNRTAALEERLGSHELGYLAANKPVLVENIINNATANINRCFEIASGSPLTAFEMAATKPSQINTECPELANPNYIETTP